MLSELWIKHTHIHTIIIFVQTIKRQPHFFLMVFKVLQKFFEVQSWISIGISSFKNVLQERRSHGRDAPRAKPRRTRAHLTPAGFRQQPLARSAVPATRLSTWNHLFYFGLCNTRVNSHHVIPNSYEAEKYLPEVINECQVSWKNKDTKTHGSCHQRPHTLLVKWDKVCEILAWPPASLFQSWPCEGTVYVQVSLGC